MLFQKCHSAPPYKYFAEYAGTTDEKTAMKKSSGKYKPPPLLSVIEAARAGEADAMEQILQHYDEVALLFEQFYRKAELLSICKPCNDLLSHLSHKDRLSGKTQKSKRKNLFGSAF